MTDSRTFHIGDLVKHFKYAGGLEYVYQIMMFATHTETGEKLVIYRSVANQKVYARPYDMFMSEVDREKYPDAKQKYRFEVIK